MVTGLTAGTSYDFQVIATNAEGSSYPSMAAMATTSVMFVGLQAPSNVMATSTDTGEMTLTWEGAENADYFILIAVDMRTLDDEVVLYDRSQVNDGMARTGDITGLDSGGDYLGIVIAVQGAAGAIDDVKHATPDGGQITVQ